VIAASIIRAMSHRPKVAEVWSFLTLNLMMETQQVSKMLVFNSLFTRLITRKDFIAFIRSESFKSNIEIFSSPPRPECTSEDHRDRLLSNECRGVKRSRVARTLDRGFQSLLRHGCLSSSFYVVLPCHKLIIRQRSPTICLSRLGNQKIRGAGTKLDYRSQ
jgi:hypothetical protein